MSKILPVILAAVGLGGGVGAGIALRPAPVEVVEINPCGDVEADHHIEPVMVDEEGANATSFVKMNNQFVISIVEEGKVTALVVMSLNLEVTGENQDVVYQREPKLRDAFLQVMFDHANTGGFNGTFTNGRNMLILRDALKKTAINIVGSAVTDVLIVDIARQDLL